VSSSIYVAINEDNEIWIGGDQVAPDLVRHLIAGLRADNPGSDLVIQADANARNQYTMSVMDAAKAAGISAVVLAAQPQ
jgi:biopolymer transport protein ExbD